MQLNNVENHEIISIQTIDTRANKIFYKRIKHSFGIENILENSYIQASVNLQDKLEENININEFCYNELLAKFPDFETSTDVQNWKISERPVRIFLRMKLAGSSLLQKDDLSTVLQREIDVNFSATEKNIFDEYPCVIAYFLQVTDEDAEILQPYIQKGEIMVETKNI